MSLPFQINFPTSLDDTTSLGQLANNIHSALTVDVDAVETTFSVNTTGMPADGIFSLDSEVMTYTGKTGSSLTGITRAVDGTTAAAHTAGTHVEVRPVAKAFTILRDAIIQAETKIGTGSSTPAANSLFAGTAAGVSGWSLVPIVGTSLQIGVASSATGSLKLAHVSSAFLTTIQAGNAAAARTYTWPTNFGPAGSVLRDTAGDGVLDWSLAGTPGGSDTQVQFNDGGTTFNGDAGLTYNKTTNVLTITSGGLVLATSGTITQTSNSATAFESGPNGATNPVFRLVNNVGSAATGLSITGRAAAAGAEIAVLSSGTNEDLVLTPKGTAAVRVGTAVYLGILSGAGATPASVGDVRIGINGSGASNTGLTLVDQTTGSLRTLSWGINNSGAWQMAFNAQAYGFDSGSAFYVKNNAQIGFISGTDLSAPTLDTSIRRDAAAGVQICNGTAGLWGYLKCGIRDAGLNTAPVGLTVGHLTSGTRASITAGMGVSLLMNADSTTTADVNAAQITALFTTPTHASIVSDLVFYTRTGGAALAEAGRFTGAKNLNIIGAVLTADPTTGVGPLWKLGARKAATVALDTTQYIEVDVGGTIYKVGIVT